LSEPNDYDQQDEEAFAALYPDSMALRIVQRGPLPGPGTVEVRLSGENNDVAIILMILRAEAEGGQFEITSERGPYPNRQEPGLRMYVTLRFPAGHTTGPAAGAMANWPGTGNARGAP
jgi:hypothetical protein